jgi:PIN domain nuclease of toxin-antitoxin system
LPRIVPISATIAAASAELPAALRDPADPLIVATSRSMQVPLLTHDAAIVRTRLAKRWVAAA